jgi:hypothetical protein
LAGLLFQAQASSVGEGRAIIIFSSSSSDQRSAQRCHTGRLADKRILRIYFGLLKRLSKRSALYMPLRLSKNFTYLFWPRETYVATFFALGIEDSCACAV